MMQLMAVCLQFLAKIFDLLPKKQRVALLSRQDSKPSLDYRLLVNNLQEELASNQIVLCLTEPETKNLPQFVLGTLKQLYYTRTSMVVVVDGYVPAVSIPKKNPDTTVIQMWHALGAIKKFGYQCLDTPAGRTSKSAQVARMHKNYDYIIAGGIGAIPAFAEAFNYPEEKILPLGLPRIDYLLDCNTNSERQIKALKVAERYPFLTNGKITVLYAPTLRKGIEYENWLTQYVKHLAQKYGDNKYNFIVAGHPLNKDFDQSLLDKYPTIQLVSDVATIDLIQFADCVISDYSAVIFEAGLLGKELKYYTPDIASYRISPGLNIEPHLIDASFIKKYFEGTSFDSTQRIAQLILKHL